MPVQRDRSATLEKSPVASGEAKAPADKPQNEESTLQFLASIATVLVAGLFVITFVLQAFEIPSGSMLKTLLIGDHVFVDRITLAPPAKWFPLVRYRALQRGDIIVFFKPGEPDLFLVKRLIGLPGDRIHLQDGVVYLNGKPQLEPYKIKTDDGSFAETFDAYRNQFPAIAPSADSQVTAEWQVELPTRIENGDLVVPPGHFFAMGDNRPDSLDSRYWGFVPQENVVGRPLFVYWSFVTPEDQVDKHSIGDRLSFMLHVIIHFFDETRWKRTLHLVR